MNPISEIVFPICYSTYSLTNVRFSLAALPPLGSRRSAPGERKIRAYVTLGHTANMKRPSQVVQTDMRATPMLLFPREAPSSRALPRPLPQVSSARLALQRAVIVGTREVRSNRELGSRKLPLAGAKARVRLPISCREKCAHPAHTARAPFFVRLHST